MAAGFIPLRNSQRPGLRAFTAGTAGGENISRFLDLPIPGVGTNGTFKFKAVAFDSGKFGRKINVGSEIIVKTGSVYYTYYSLADIPAKNFDETISVPVYPPIQAAHLEDNSVILDPEKFQQRVGETVIGPMLSTSVGSTRLYADALYESETNLNGQGMPYVRDWPEANDPIGIPWGQSDLLALSFRPLNGGDHREVDDAYKSSNVYFAPSGLTHQVWTNLDRLPVPRVISSAYTKRTRRDDARYRVNETSFGTADDYYNDFERFRTATGNHWRVSSFGAFPYARYHWLPGVQAFTNKLSVTNSTSGTGGPMGYNPGTGLINNVARMNGYISNIWSGSRGGRYSLSGFAAGSPGGTCGFTLEVWTTNPGGSDIMLKSIVVPDCSTPPGAPQRVNGTWSAIHLPTNEGTVGSIYCKALPVDPLSTEVYLHDTNDVLNIFCTGNIPWAYSIATGNLVAPGGLIAPFY